MGGIAIRVINTHMTLQMPAIQRPQITHLSAILPQLLYFSIFTLYWERSSNIYYNDAADMDEWTVTEW